LAIAAPVGPIGLLVIQRSLQHGRTVGLATGLGAAAADAVYGAVGAFGVAAIVQALQQVKVPLALGGGAFLLWLAWRTWHAAPATHAAPVHAAPGLWASFGATFVLTLSNPATILSFIAIFGSMAGKGAPASPWTMVAGVLLGSALWWLVLSTAVASMRERLREGVQRRIARASALGLAAFALWQGAALL
jgi:threonine/homoserine/homoserine lactone efflux protein